MELTERRDLRGATAASTALVIWGADVPLTHLARTFGQDEAARRWYRAFEAVRNLTDLSLAVHPVGSRHPEGMRNFRSILCKLGKVRREVRFIGAARRVEKAFSDCRAWF